MAEALVLDASAALAILRAEPAAAGVLRLLAAVPPGDEGVLVPDHFWLELGNVLVRRHRWAPDSVITAFRELDELGVRTVPIERPLMLLGLDLMSSHGLSAYDAAYLALAEVEDAALLTLDGDLAAAAGPRALVPGRGRASEPRTPYGSPWRRPTWAGHGRYLAELRRRALST